MHLVQNSRDKTTDRLVDLCKHSSVNRMAAGLRLSSSSHEIFFSFLLTFQTHRI